jgi:hypothetical protein
VYPVCTAVHPNWPVVFAIIGVPRGSPGTAPDVRHRKSDGPGRSSDGPGRSSDGPTASRVVDLPSRDGGSPKAVVYRN